MLGKLHYQSISICTCKVGIADLSAHNMCMTIDPETAVMRGIAFQLLLFHKENKLPLLMTFLLRQITPAQRLFIIA